MVRAPCCEKTGLKRGPWTQEEDDILVDYINKNGGPGNWRSLPKLAGLLRCGKSCRLRWTNYLRPDIKRGPFTPEEEQLIIQLHAILGNRWAAMAGRLPGRTDNEIKNLWNTHLRKRLISMGLDPQNHEPSCLKGSAKRLPTSSSARHMAQWESARPEAEAQLLMDSSASLLLPSPNRTTHLDYILRVWHSEVGESFSNRKPAVCFSPASQASVSGTTSKMVPKTEPELDTELSCATRSEMEPKTEPVCFSPASQASVSGTTSEMEPKTEPELDKELSCARRSDDCITSYHGLTHPLSPSEMEDYNRFLISMGRKI